MVGRSVHALERLTHPSSSRGRLASALALIVLFMPHIVSGQGFMVKPMLIEVYPRAGETIERRMELRNTSAAQGVMMTVETVLLTQGAEGGWGTIAPGEVAGADQVHLTSCRDWLYLSRDTVRVPPMAMESVDLRLAVPRTARGFYGAAVVVRTVPGPRPAPVLGQAQVDLVIRMLIPVLVETQGPPARKLIELQDAGIARADSAGVAADPVARKTTRAHLKVSNSGQVMARVAGQMTVLRQAGNDWVRAIEASFPEKRIIPGVSFTLTADLGRTLPSGRYRLDAALMVDGSRRPRLHKEVDFEGEPGDSALAVYAQLTVKPNQVEVRGLAGAVRSASVVVHNPGADAVDVSGAVLEPQSLQGVAYGDITGDQYSAHDWVTVSPSQFSIPAGGVRTIRMDVGYPRTGTEKPCYYSTLRLVATYPDGQSAGSAEVLVLAVNDKQKPAPRAEGTGLNLAREHGNIYSLVAAYGNVGDIYLDLSCSGKLTDPMAITAIRQFALTGDSALVLPLGMTRFSGVVDFSGVRPGPYVIVAAARYAGQTATQEIPVRVRDQGTTKIVEVLRKRAR